MLDRPPLDRSAWLDAALDALYEEGEGGVKVEPLARRLGVTKGSFYHHFHSRQELLAAMIDRWRATQEAHLEALAGSPRQPADQRIAELIAFTERKDSRHDVGMRAWALHRPDARRAVQAIDRQRLEFIESLFADLGFVADEARLRARLLYFYQVGEYTLSAQSRDDSRERLRALRWKLLTAR